MSSALAPVRPVSSARTTRHLARLGMRRARRLAREILRGGRVPELALASGDLVLTPAESADAAAWDGLVARPPAEGLAASSLGGAAHTVRQWEERLRSLRSAGDRAYLVRIDGRLAGEALVFTDAGTELAELVVWLAEGWAARLADVADLLAQHVLDTAGVRRVLLCVARDVDVDAVRERGFVQEGAFSDPPFPERAVLIRHASAASTASAPSPR